MEGLYLTTGKKTYLWEKKVIDPLDKSICKQEIKKKKCSLSFKIILNDIFQEIS